MAKRWRLHKGDHVYVLAGKDKGKTGEILRVLRQKDRVVVAGINMITLHQKPSSTFPEGGLVKKEGSLHISNVAHLDTDTQRPTRIGIRFLEDGKKVRYAKRSGGIIDR